MGFEGFVVSDCGAVENLVDESHWSPNISAAVAASIIAGVCIYVCTHAFACV